MKKIIITTLTVILLTGCGNKIVCKTNNGTVSETYKIKYNSNNVTDIETSKIYKFDSKEDFKNFEKTIVYLAKSNTKENIKTTYAKKNKKYILKQIYNIEKLNDEELKQYGLSKNKEELINNLKSNGLTCK